MNGKIQCALENCQLNLAHGAELKKDRQAKWMIGRLRNGRPRARVKNRVVR